jgi:MinD-like ATPase involved in chromosome partitioning or flagellar assembly
MNHQQITPTGSAFSRRSNAAPMFYAGEESVVMSVEYGPNEQPQNGGGEYLPPRSSLSESTVAPPPMALPDQPGLPPQPWPPEEPLGRPSGENTPPHGWNPTQAAQRAASQQPQPNMSPPFQGQLAPPAPGLASPTVPAPPPFPNASERRSRHGYAQTGPPTADLGDAQAASVIRSERTSVSMGHVSVRSATKLPPERGWRRWLMLLTHINMGLSPDEVYERELHTKIRKIVTSPNETSTNQGYQVAVMSLKGGVGKTAMTVLLGSALAKIRAHPILAIDANPDAGNLVKRSGKQSEYSIAQLVAAADQVRTYNAVRAHTSQNEANLEVLASQDYVDAPRAFCGSDWKTAIDVVSPYYPIIAADCGTGLFHAAAQAVLESVWAVVIVTGTSIDEAEQSAATLDWMKAHGYANLVSRAVVVINHTKRGRGSANLDEVKAQFAQTVGQNNVFEVPFDPHIGEGVEINLRLVNRLVLRRITEVAAALSENFDRPRRVPTRHAGPVK